jgi:hypothetical protein
LKRWSQFLDGTASVAAAAALAIFRALSPVPLSRLEVPLRIKGVEDPLYFRPGTTDFHTLVQLWDQDEYALANEFVDGPVEMVVDLGSERASALGARTRYSQAGTEWIV